MTTGTEINQERLAFLKANERKIVLVQAVVRSWFAKKRVSKLRRPFFVSAACHNANAEQASR